MIQKDATIYLVFNFSEMDLRRYMDHVRRPGLTAGHIKVNHKSYVLLQCETISSYFKGKK